MTDPTKIATWDVQGRTGVHTYRLVRNQDTIYLEIARKDAMDQVAWDLVQEVVWEPGWKLPAVEADRNLVLLYSLLRRRVI